jgi:hypothetical protein
MSQAEWNAARAKLQSSPDYVMVRRSAQAGQFAGDKKGGQDGIAVNWFEINKLDLPAATGGKAYDDTVIKKDLADLQDEVDVLQDQVDAIVVPDTSSLATKKELTEFLESFTTQQFQDVQKFFDTMPKLKHEVEVTNPKTKKKNKIVLQGLSDFFG